MFISRDRIVAGAGAHHLKCSTTFVRSTETQLNEAGWATAKLSKGFSQGSLINALFLRFRNWSQGCGLVAGARPGEQRPDVSHVLQSRDA